MNEKFEIYLKLLAEYNQQVNLVSSAEPDIVKNKHFADSLAIGKLYKFIDFTASLKVIDVGIGGGFPGMPVVIEYPGFSLCAVDSVGKKLEFIRVLAEKLGISDRVEIVNARAEELGHCPEKREAFDLAVIRAVAKLNVIAEYCLPFVKVGGYFVAYKAKTAEQELEAAQNAIELLGGEVVAIEKYILKDGEERNLIVIKKIKPTPQKYPRKVGVPAKRPL